MTTWPPFQADNEASLRHGARSTRHLSPIVAELRASVAEAAPWTLAPAFGPALEAWLWSEAQAILYRRWFDERGLWAGDGSPLPGLVLYNRAEGRAAQLRQALGLDPRSLVAILGQLAAHEPEAMAGALETMLATGREIRQAAERRQIAAAPPEEAGHGQ